MPVMDGLEASQVILDSYPNIPIIALTAYWSEEVKIRCLKQGMREVINKPIMGADLERLVKTYI